MESVQSSAGQLVPYGLLISIEVRGRQNGEGKPHFMVLTLS